jgi:hypothetical protein
MPSANAVPSLEDVGRCIQACELVCHKSPETLPSSARRLRADAGSRKTHGLVTILNAPVGEEDENSRRQPSMRGVRSLTRRSGRPRRHDDIEG